MRYRAQGPVIVDDISGWFETLDRAWVSATAEDRGAPGPTTLLFSGGVDSGFIAWEFRHRSGLTLSTVGVPGSHDLRAAESAARTLDLPWHGVPVSAEEVGSVAHELADELTGLGPTSRSVHVAFSLALRNAPEGKVLCGQGADELFLGYAHFRGLSEPDAGRRALVDLDRLRTEDWPRSVRIAKRWGRTLTAPYLEPAFVDAATRIPIAARMPGTAAKSLFRSWTRHRGLPVSIAERPKRALQFGSGVDRVLARAPPLRRP
jgi:asparagine synthase (glutamine-hydrolysing)